VEEWDELYSSDDPYGYEGTEERARYEWTLAALEGRRFARALELGCSVGVFTEMLAPQCDELVALDVSARALERAADRLGARPEVQLERGAVPDDLPEGPFDLIVCSDVLAYSVPDQVLVALRRIEGALASGGVLLAAHWRPPTPTHRLSGDRVHRLLTRHTTLRRTGRAFRGNHRLDILEKHPASP